MNCNTGEVMPIEESYNRIRLDPTSERLYKEVPFQLVRAKTGRNEPCPCHSGKKFKRCCYMEK